MALNPITWPRPADDIDSFQTYLGVNYRLRGGQIFTHPANVLQATLYDIDYITDNYKEDSVTSQKFITDPGTLTTYPIFESLTENFQEPTDVRTLIGPSANWNSMTLQSPKASTVPEYVALKQAILAGTSGFLDNRIDIVNETTSAAPIAAKRMRNSYLQKMNYNYLAPGAFFTPRKLARFLAVAKGSTSLTKASVDNELMFLSKGDTFRAIATFFVESGTPTGLFDIEAAYITEGPGMRVLFDNMVPYVELKWLDKPTYTQNGAPVAVQRGVWNKIQVEYVLTDATSGTVKLWLNDVLIIDRTGQTLPVPDAVYTRFEFGIPANDQNTDCVVYAEIVAIE